MNRWQTDRLTRLRGNGWNKPSTRSKRPQVVYAPASGNASAPLPPCEIHSAGREQDWRSRAVYHALVAVIATATIAGALVMMDTDHPVMAGFILLFGFLAICAAD